MPDATTGRRGGVRPGQRDLDRHRARWSGAAGQHGHGAARRQGPRDRLWTAPASCTTRTSGTWTATGKMTTPRSQPHGHPAARRQGARGGRLRPSATSRRTRPSCTTRTRGPGPRSRTCTARARRASGRPRCCPMARCSWWASGRLRSPSVRPGHRNLDRTRWSRPSSATERQRCCRMAPCWWQVSTIMPSPTAGRPVPPRRCTTRAPGRGRPPRACSGAATAPRSRSCSTARSSWQVAVTVTMTVCVLRRARRSCTSLPACRRRRCQPSRARPRQSSRARPRGPDAVPARGRSRSAERSVLEGHGRQQELRARDAVRGRGGRERGVTARRVRDPERGPSRRHREGDLPLPCQGRDDGWIFVNPRPGEGGSLVSADRHRHPRQDPDHERTGEWGWLSP